MTPRYGTVQNETHQVGDEIHNHINQVQDELHQLRSELRQLRDSMHGFIDLLRQQVHVPKASTAHEPLRRPGASVDEQKMPLPDSTEQTSSVFPFTYQCCND